jgi:hypothetical protein
VLPKILKEMPAGAFAFFLIDPKHWHIRLRDLAALLARPHSEVIFNFMFDFINRAASIRDPAVATALDDLIPCGGWASKLEKAERSGNVTSDQRKAILIDAFGTSLKKFGNYEYVAETTVLRPLKDRPLYCLFYATRHPVGIEVFRDCQVEALQEESRARAAIRVRHIANTTGQRELFESLHDMAPNELEAFLSEQRVEAAKSLLALAPKSPRFSIYADLRAHVLARHVVRASDVNKIAARLRKEKQLLFPDWEKGKRVPQSGYRTQRG